MCRHKLINVLYYVFRYDYKITGFILVSPGVNAVLFLIRHFASLALLDSRADLCGYPRGWPQ